MQPLKNEHEQDKSEFLEKIAQHTQPLFTFPKLTYKMINQQNKYTTDEFEEIKVALVKNQNIHSVMMGTQSSSYQVTDYEYSGAHSYNDSGGWEQCFREISHEDGIEFFCPEKEMNKILGSRDMFRSHISDLKDANGLENITKHLQQICAIKKECGAYYKYFVTPEEDLKLQDVIRRKIDDALSQLKNKSIDGDIKSIRDLKNIVEDIFFMKVIREVPSTYPKMGPLPGWKDLLATEKTVYENSLSARLTQFNDWLNNYLLNYPQTPEAEQLRGTFRQLERIMSISNSSLPEKAAGFLNVHTRLVASDQQSTGRQSNTLSQLLYKFGHWEVNVAAADQSFAQGVRIADDICKLLKELPETTDAAKRVQKEVERAAVPDGAHLQQTIQNNP